MRVFVTGASGFIGRHLVEHLARSGHEVTALAHRTEGSGAARTVKGDITRPETFDEALAQAQAVVHCAALVDPIDDEAQADAVNHRASVELAKLAAARGVSTFVFLSSIAAIGRQWDAGLVDENVLCEPNTPYARSKRSAELGLMDLQKNGFRVAVVRPPTVYGVGDTRGNLLGLARAIRSGFFVVPGNGRNRISFCSVNNLCAAIERLLLAPAASGIFHVADSMETTFGGVVKHLADTMGARLLPIPFPLPVANLVARALEEAGARLGFNPPLSRVRLASIASDFAFDVSKLLAVGHRHVEGFESASAETIRWYQSQGLLKA